MAVWRFLFFIFLFASSLAYGQDFRKNIEIDAVLNRNYLGSDSCGNEALTILASSFNLSKKGIEVEIAGKLTCEIDLELDGKYILSVSFLQKKIKGDVVYEGFNAGYLLWPSMFQSKIVFYNGRHVRGSVEVTCFTNGQKSTFDVTEFVTGTIGELSLRVLDQRFIYEKTQPDGLENWVDEVFAYNSFVMLLNDLNKKFSKFASDSKRKQEYLLLDRIEIARMTYLLDQRDFFLSLHAIESDPKKMFSTWANIQRYEQRVVTLSQPIEDGWGKNFQTDTFCLSLTNLSNAYLAQSKLLQPAQATAWLSMAVVPEHDSEMAILYGGLPENTVVGIRRCAYNAFVNSGAVESSRGDYAGALLLLRNATIMAGSTAVIPDLEFQEVYLEAFEGIASSFFKVGKMALKNGNLALAITYFQKGYDMVAQNQQLFSGFESRDSAMPAFFNEILAIAEHADLSFLPASRLYHFEVCSPMVDIFGKAWSNSFYAAYAESIKRVFISNISLLESQLNFRQYPDASAQLDSIDLFYNKYAFYLAGEEGSVTVLAERLYDVYMAQSHELLLANQSQVALDQLLLASDIGKWLPDGATAEINAEILTVSGALIADYVKKIKYHIWALRLDEAEGLLAEVESIENQYLNGANSEVLKLIADTYLELDSRACQALQQKLNNNINEIKTALKNKSYQAAVRAFEVSQENLNSHAECELNRSAYDEIKPVCRHLVYYLEQSDSLKQQLYSQGYSQVIERYVALADFVYANNLDTLGVGMTSLFTFVSHQNLPMLTLQTGEFYVQRGQYDKALEYARMAKKQGVLKKQARSLQSQIASGLAHQDKNSNISVDEALDEYTYNDQWFSHFKIVYRKNRLL